MAILIELSDRQHFKFQEGEGEQGFNIQYSIFASDRTFTMMKGGLPKVSSFPGPPSLALTPVSQSVYCFPSGESIVSRCSITHTASLGSLDLPAINRSQRDEPR